MLIKHADDKTKRLALLEDLQRSSLLDKRQREWLKDEHYRTLQGLQGERDAAHYIDNWLKDGVNHAVLHDLRISFDARDCTDRPPRDQPCAALLPVRDQVLQWPSADQCAR